MNIYQWFKIFNTAEFDALGLVSRTLNLNLEGRGELEFLVTKGNLYGITHDGIFLALEQSDENPFEFESRAIYRDENNDVFWGFLVEA